MVTMKIGTGSSKFNFVSFPNDIVQKVNAKRMQLCITVNVLGLYVLGHKETT